MMSSNAFAKTGSTKTQQSQPNIHPLFRKSQFVGFIDYDTVFRGAAILATRLLDTPQALHWAYAFLYGTNMKAETPLGFIPEGYASAPKEAEVPRQYACNKAIGQLTAKDIADVRKALAELAHKCHFQVREMASCGEAEELSTNEGYSTISIRGDIYRRALLRKNYNKKERALIDFDLAITMLHEIAHALNIYYMRNRLEDFFESSLVAEHGWELESRLFGLVPVIASTGSPLESSGPSWSPWQTWELFRNTPYQPEYICRSQWKVPKTCPQFAMNPKFAIKLCSDVFWEEEYLQKGAVALIPDIVRDLCLTGKSDVATKAIPPSIRELFRQNAGGKSYAEKKYPNFTRPRFGYRKAFVDPDDEDSEGETNDDAGTDAEAEWSEGEETDASGYNTEDMTDESDDDATVCGSDDEMTEVEEWVTGPSAKVKAKVKAVEFELFYLDAEIR